MTWARHVGEASWSPEANARPRGLHAPGSGHLLRSAGSWAQLVTHPSASAATLTTVATLASELGRVYGVAAPSRVSSSTATEGIRVGLASEWGLSISGSWDWRIGDLGGRAYVLGRTDRGLGVAIRRLLHLLGYRRLTTVAERLPAMPASGVLTLPIEARPLPFRFFQGLSNQLVNPDQQQARVDAWNTQNAAADDLLWSSGHSWGAIIAANLATFQANPGYTGGGSTGASAKLACYSSAVIAMALTYTQGQFAAGTRHGSSLSATDGEGWDLATGTGEESKVASDRVLHLAGAVQPSLGADQHVVIQAYGQASLPPVTETVATGVVVMVTTAFLRGGQSWENVVDAFTAAGGGLFALYDYKNEWIWSGVQDRPGGAAATTRAWAVQTAGRLARCMGYNGEDAAGGAAVVGRGRYAIAGVCVGDDAATRWDEYPDAMFPSATVQSDAWFAAMESGVPFTTDLVHQLLVAALALISATGSSTVAGEHESALDCARYAYYCHLLRAWTSSATTAAFEALLRWCWRDRHRDQWCFLAPYSTSLWATQRQAVAALHSLSDLTSSSGATIWGDAQTTEPELVALLTAALALNPTIPFATVGYSTDLVRVSGLTTTRSRGLFGTSTATNRSVQFWLQGSGSTHFVFNGGVLRQDLGPDHVTISARDSGTVLLDVDVSETGPDQAYDLVLDPAVLYLVDVTSKGGVAITTPVGTGFSHVFDPSDTPFQSSCNVFVYVPLGTTTFGFFANGGTVSVFDRVGTRIFGPTVASGSYLSFAVPVGVAGTAVEVVGTASTWSPLTTPPSGALAPGELFVPRDVAIADGLTYTG